MERSPEIDERDLEALIAAQLKDCTPDQQDYFGHIKVALRPVPICTGNFAQRFFLVAQIGTTVLYYNDVEEGFNISSLAIDGSISRLGCEQWELCHALNQLVAA